MDESRLHLHAKCRRSCCCHEAPREKRSIALRRILTLIDEYTRECLAAGDWPELRQLWRVPLDGSGKPEPIPGSGVPDAILLERGIGISPDGKTLAYIFNVENPEIESGTDKIALLDVATLKSPRLHDANPRISRGVQFTADGRAVAYPVGENGVDNIWIQPIDELSGPPDYALQFRANPVVSLVTGWQKSWHTARAHRF